MDQNYAVYQKYNPISVSFIDGKLRCIMYMNGKLHYLGVVNYTDFKEKQHTDP